MTQRLFKLKGQVKGLTATATGSMTINGTEVFNGTFSQGSSDEPDGFLCEFAYAIDDSAGTDIQLPVVVTVATGTLGIGMFKYNYARVVNPALTQEELVYVNTKTISDAPVEIQADVESKGGWLICDETAFSYGISPDLCHDNRTMATLNGIPISDEFDRTYIWTPAGSVLTFTTIMFSSVGPPAPV